MPPVAMTGTCTVSTTAGSSENRPTIKASAYPTLGSGAYYDGVCEIVGPRATLASAGSRVAKGTIAKDVRGGLLGTVPPGLAFMHRVRKAYDRVLVIGICGQIQADRQQSSHDVVDIDVQRFRIDVQLQFHGRSTTKSGAA